MKIAPVTNSSSDRISKNTYRLNRRGTRGGGGEKKFLNKFFCRFRKIIKAWEPRGGGEVP